MGGIYFSIDFESNGNAPISVGIVAFDHEGNEIDHFSANIKPHTPGRPSTLKWLEDTIIKRNGDTLTLAQNCAIGAKHISIAVREATIWCMDTIKNSNANTGYLVCFPSAFDGHLWISMCETYNIHGYQDFMDRFPSARADPEGLNYRDPFGFNHIDGQTYAMGKLGLSSRESLRKLKPKFFTQKELQDFSIMQHDAVADARIQGELFFRISRHQ